MTADEEQQDGTAAAEGRRWGIWLPLATLVVAMVLSAVISLGVSRYADGLAEMFPGLLRDQRPATPSPLEQKVAALGARMAKLESAAATIREQAQATATERAALQQELGALQPQVAGLAALTKRLTALGLRLDDAESQMQAQAAKNRAAAESRDQATAGAAATAAMAERLQTFETALAGRRGEDGRQDRESAALKQQLAAQESALATTRAQLAALAKQRGEMLSGGNGALLALALGRLRDAVGNRPFADQLTALQKLMPPPTAASGLSEVLAALEKRAAAGVVSRPELSRRFAALAGPAVRAGSGGKGGWLEATRRRLSGLVSLRRTGAQAGDSVEARVARAEAGMARGDLAAALAEVAALEGGAAEVLAPWRQAAADRLAVERALATLESRLPDLLVASGSP